MALSYFKTFVWVMFPPPLLLLGLLLLPLPNALRNATLRFSDSVLFLKVHPSLKLSLFWFCLLLSTLTFLSCIQAVAEKREIYQSAKINGNACEQLVKLLGAERNAWISGTACALWVILHRFRSVFKAHRMLEMQVEAAVAQEAKKEK
eukprot:CAMPEP_0202040404 /NCGR_PEP_ID=MMETSP0962-20130828/20552_1 /ASSEMBLY_ACC=CAM_ASM_000488 /TAXON_ID=4773 /ORGANISM="Schizochytrium aggregatum, Strain ATCC28209" /LENGTH=147 /DNA_ID=CAMNT_0048604677 /DNA_START=77 /DNA_END=520 /DNA_ORIENTATION=-